MYPFRKLPAYIGMIYDIDILLPSFSFLLFSAYDSDNNEIDTHSHAFVFFAILFPKSILIIVLSVIGRPHVNLP